MDAVVTNSKPRHSFQTDDPALIPIARKVENGERLSFDDGLALYRSADILAVGWMANLVRERMHGDVAYFNVNRHINPTNVCVASCTLVRLRPQEGRGGHLHHGPRRGLGDCRQRPDRGGDRVPHRRRAASDLPFEYFVDLFSGLKQRYPQVHIKAFTMVEIAFLAKRGKLSVAEAIERMKLAGVDSLPGGGAEIFADRVRHIICDHKIDGSEWLDTARLAHKAGLRSNATMLYGHIENDEDRVDHLLKLRELQDETGGFQTFIPLGLPS